MLKACNGLTTKANRISLLVGTFLLLVGAIMPFPVRATTPPTFVQVKISQGGRTIANSIIAVGVKDWMPNLRGRSDHARGSFLDQASSPSAPKMINDSLIRSPSKIRVIGITSSAEADGKIAVKVVFHDTQHHTTPHSKIELSPQGQGQTEFAYPGGDITIVASTTGYISHQT